MNDLAAFAQLVQAIEPWRESLVLVGGWAHRLHRFHPLAAPPDYAPIVTKDTDLAFGGDAPLEGDIKSALLAAGFREELAGNHRPPVAHYALGHDDGGFYAEFLTPLRGSAVKRRGKVDATVSAAGITAQKLRYLDILLVEPWTVTIGSDQDIPVLEPKQALVANPASFIVQKLLIHKDRSPAKRAQDVLYIHDTIELFGASLPVLQSTWNDRVRPTLSDKAARQVGILADAMFSEVTDVIRDSVRIPLDRSLSADRLRAACELALSMILAN